jgi:hypothetical protein
MTAINASHDKLGAWGKGGTAHHAACSCPACQGLHTFVRPRFFAGQLLTETELSALTGYVVDKQKLHNRYLHGYGVVCGLQVECDGCGPGVLVRPGYAIDPCGADIVLPEAISVPILKLIAQCTATNRAADCDPPRYPRAEGCSDAEQVWCLWVRYSEQQARPVTPLGGAAASSGCGCGGSGSSGGCGCSGTQATASSNSGSSGCGCGGGGNAHGSRATTCGCTNAPAQPPRPAACEPSRIYEYVEFGVAPKDADCGTLEGALGGTFPARVVECIEHLQPVLTKGLSKPMQSSALSVVAGGQVGLSAGAARDALCQLYANVVELYRNDPMRTQCVLPEELSTIDCSPRGDNESDSAFRVRLSVGLQQLVMLVLLYLRDCVCYAALPPCPPASCDDRVVLACVTVKNGVVTKVCNHACRHYAGSFVNREYWLPIGPVLSLLAAKLCCFPLGMPRGVRLQGDVGADRMVAKPQAAASYVPLWRVDNLLSAVRSDNFALPKLWNDRVRNALAQVRVGTVLAGVERSLEKSRGSVRLASYLHADAADAAASLKAKGVQVKLVEVADKVDGLSFDAIPRVAKDGFATLFTHGGVVVGVKGTEGINLKKAPQ